MPLQPDSAVRLVMARPTGRWPSVPKLSSAPSIAPRPTFAEAFSSPREVLASLTELADLHRLLAELRLLELEADSRRLQLLREGVGEGFRDETLDSKQLALYLGVSPDWLSRHRDLYQAAQVNPANCRPRYSKFAIDSLRQHRSKRKRP